MKKYADYRTPSYNGIIRPSNIWTRGVYYEGTDGVALRFSSGRVL